MTLDIQPGPVDLKTNSDISPDRPEPDLQALKLPVRFIQAAIAHDLGGTIEPGSVDG